MSFALDLLLARADDHGPVLEGGLPLDAAADAPAPAGAPAGPAHFADFGDDPNDLAIQRWGIVAPEGPDGDRLLDRVARLRAARELAQGAEARIYRAPAGLDAPAAARWKRVVYRDESVPEDELPRYLLVLGDLDGVSLEVQQALGSDLFVGRLACASDAGYDAYVEKVLRSEAAGPAALPPRALFFSARDGTAATTVGHRALVAPSVAVCRARMERGAFRASAVDELVCDPGAASRDALMDAVAADEPALLFTMSHGLGPPRGGFRSDVERRAVQGAMSLGEGARLGADDVAGAPFLPGGVWFLLACYGGGTPSSSAYGAWLARLRDAGAFAGRVDAVLAGLAPPGSPPFVAALPKAALASPRGPLAVIAHVDLAWTYAFQDMGADRRDRASRFQGLLRSVVAGARVGAAHHELARFAGEATFELAALDDAASRANGGAEGGAARAAHRAHLWMLRQDLGGYVVLGDPAARLAVAR